VFVEPHVQGDAPHKFIQLFQDHQILRVHSFTPTFLFDFKY